MPRRGVRAIGIVLILPAVALGIWQLVLPSWQTMRFSFYSLPGFARGPGRFLGLESYLGPWDDWTVAVTSLIGVAAFLVVGLVGLVLGVLTVRAQGRARLAVRAVLGVTMILYAPIGLGLALRTDIRGGSDAQLLFWILGVVLLPIGSALTAVVIAAALRPDGTTEPRERVRTVAVMFGLGLVTALALALQMLAFPAVVIGNGADTLGQAIYRYGFQFLDVARAAAISTAMLTVLAVLGVLVTVVLLMLRLRVELIPDEPAALADDRSPDHSLGSAGGSRLGPCPADSGRLSRAGPRVGVRACGARSRGAVGDRCRRRGPEHLAAAGRSPPPSRCWWVHWPASRSARCDRSARAARRCSCCLPPACSSA